MGLFSKLFRNKSNIIDEVSNHMKRDSSEYYESRRPIDETKPSVPMKKAKGPSGFSWGPEMPDEENQYNYNGTYKEYFDGIFKYEFSQYNIECYDVNNGRTTVFTFYDGTRKALVVELLSRKSSAYKLRSDCRAEGVPYLRYYYDYHGWWNTREYVRQRTQNALMG